jgi:hypothetical protein
MYPANQILPVNVREECGIPQHHVVGGHTDVEGWGIFQRGTLILVPHVCQHADPRCVLHQLYYYCAKLSIRLAAYKKTKGDIQLK